MLVLEVDRCFIGLAPVLLLLVAGELGAAINDIAALFLSMITIFLF